MAQNDEIALPVSKPEAWQGELFPEGTDVEKKFKEQRAENKTRVYEHLKNKGLRPEAIAAIMGNIEVETGGSFSPSQRQTRSGKARGKNLVSRGGIGLFQFDDYKRGEGHRSWYQEYLKDSGKEDSPEAQIDYVIDTIYAEKESPNYKFKKRMGVGDAEVLKQYLETTEDPARISDAFLDRFEKAGIPHSSRRRDATAEYYQDIKSGDLDRGFFKKLFGRYNEGGVVPMKKQMELFEDGGLMDEGNTIDPVSGNDVPVGSTQEEVRDDIPAQLSEGEFVFPADVVRYHGLEKLMEMRQEAKQGLQVMDAMGQMGNSEEAIIPDDIPFSMDDLELENNTQSFAVGGMPQGVGQIPSGMTASPTGIISTGPITGAGQFAQLQTASPYAMQPAPQQLPQPAPMVTAQQLIPQTQLRQYINESGQIITIPFSNGQPIYPIPAGFKPYTEETAAPAAPPTAVAPPAPTQPQDDGGEPSDKFGQGAVTVFGGTSQDGYIRGGTKYEVAYDSSGLGGGFQLPGILGLVTGNFDQRTLTNEAGTKVSMSKDLYDTLKENRTSTETTDVLEKLFEKSPMALEAVRSDPQYDAGIFGTGLRGNEKELDSKMARQLMVDSGLEYKGQSLAEAMVLSDEVIAKAGEAAPQPAATTTPTTDVTQRFAPSGTPFGAGAQAPATEYQRAIAEGTPLVVPSDTASALSKGTTRRATEGDVARLQGMADVKVGQTLTPIEQRMSDERVMERVDAPTAPVTREVEISTISRFGRDVDYQKVGDDYFRVKDDGTLARDPASGLTEANLRNEESPLVTRSTRTIDTGERIALPTPRPERPQVALPTPRPTRPGFTEIDAEGVVAEESRIAAEQAAKAARDRAAAEETAQREQVREAAKERAEQERDAASGKGNIVQDGSGRPVMSSSGPVTTSAGSRVDRDTIDKQAAAMRAVADRKEQEAKQDKDDSDPGKSIVCTEMYRQTELEDWAKAMKIWDTYQKKYLTPLHEVGYHWLFKPYVRGMQKSNILTSLGAYLAKERTQHLRHVLTKGRAKDSLVGNLWCKIIHPIVYVAGKIKNG